MYASAWPGASAAPYGTEASFTGYNATAAAAPSSSSSASAYPGARRGLPRSSLACLSCRVAKSKCDGIIPAAIAASAASATGPETSSNQASAATSSASTAPIEAESPCSRCLRLGLSCTWRPCQRLGRPPGSGAAKKAKAEASAAEASSKRTRRDGHFSQSSSSSLPLRAQPIRQDQPSSGEVTPESSRESGTRGRSTQVHSSTGASSLGPSENDEDDDDDDEPDDLLAASVADDMKLAATYFAASSGSGDATGSMKLPDNLDALIASWVEAAATENVGLSPTPIHQCDRRVIPPSSSAAQQVSAIQERMKGISPLEHDQRGPALQPKQHVLHCVGLPIAIHSGLERYFAGVGNAIPILGKAEAFMQRAASADPALLTAAACLGHVLHEGHEGEQYNLLRSQSLKAFNDSVLAQPTQYAGAITINTLDRISALALVVYADYGAGDMMLAHEHMAMARKMAIQAGLHQIDAGEATAVASPNVERNRLVWWELFTLDVILDVATGGMVPGGLSSVPTAVHKPSMELGMDDVYEIRVRAVTLLSETLKDPVNASDQPRLDACDAILANLLGRAQSVWVLRLRRGIQHQQQSAHEAQYNDLLIMRPLLQGLLILHAARIHLHRQAWFGGLTLDLTSCSFVRAPNAPSGATGEIPKGMSQPEPVVFDSVDPGRLSASVEHITRSADAILNLMQLDADMHFARLQTALGAGRGDPSSPDVLAVPLVSPHWPFVGCCQMVASYGFAIAAAAAGQMSSSSSSSFSSSQQAPNQAPQESIASQGLALPSPADANAWRVRRSISSIGFAESTLGILMQVWKVAGMYRQEVHRCRLAIDQIR